MPSSAAVIESGAQQPDHRARSLLPREHGASMELVFPLLSAFAVGTPTTAAIAYAVAAILAFVSHEALLVLLGHRGARQAERARGVARVWLATLGGGAALLGVPALVAFSTAARVATLVPMVLAVVVLWLTVRGVRERSLGVELLVVVILTTLAVPVALECGAPLQSALQNAASWCVAFSVGTFGARGVLYRQKDGGRGLRVAQGLGALVLALGVTGTLLAPSGWRTLLAPAPFAVAALVLGTLPPPPTKMMAIGFALVAASTLTLVLLAAPAG